jgi:exoribonuclease-2
MDLQLVAAQLMRENGFATEMPPPVTAQAKELQQHPPAVATHADVKDLRHLPWSSIDNASSRDLDQLEVAEPAADDATRVLVAIADVDAFVAKATPIDTFAAAQTTTVYTDVKIFPMLPETLSTGATSLLEGGEKLAVVVEFAVGADGQLQSNAVYRALVRNRAQLAYHDIGAWLDGHAPAPVKVAESSTLEAQLRLQDRVARALRRARHRHGALNLNTIETRTVMRDQEIVSLEVEHKNGATSLIEDFMIAANEIVARLLESREVSFIRRIVKTPERWDRIVQLAGGFGTTLPPAPDSRALNEFLTERCEADPDHFADLSLAVVKLIGRGEYVLERKGEEGEGHFGLAVEDYTHSTAPNRRFPDLVTQRLVKAVVAGQPAPYGDDELMQIAANCTAKANAARKVEREVSKRVAAVAMQRRIGEHFQAIVTGVTPRGTFVRVLNPPVEGLLARGQQGVDVGDKIGVTLVSVDVGRGFIDFARSQGGSGRSVG